MKDSTQLRMGQGPVLMVDRHLIKACAGVTHKWHQPQRPIEQPLIKADRPWENTLYFTYSNYQVLYDPADGLIKCWYEDLGKLTPESPHPIDTRLLYAESRDGVHFEKPELDVCELDGRKTNIVMGFADGQSPTALNPWADIGVHSNGIVIDPHPPTPDQRFRTIYSRSSRRKNRPAHDIECAHSPDGIHWTPYEQRPSAGSSGHQFGDVSFAYYDPVGRVFVQNTRHSAMGNVAHSPATPPARPWGHITYPFQPGMQARRRVFQTRSPDFLHWSEPQPIAVPDDNIDNLDEYLYGMGQFQVGRHHFGTLGIFRHVENTMHVRLMHSWDGNNFEPTNNAQPWLAARGQGHWDTHMVSLIAPPVRIGDQWHFYHGGTSSHHDWWMSGGESIDHPEAHDPANNVNFGLGLATLRVNGFASLQARPPREGWVDLAPMHLTGKKLVINGRCQPGGEIRVAVLDGLGQEKPDAGRDQCDPFTGDSVHHRMTWQGNPDCLPNGWTTLRIYLRNAELFAIEVEP